MYCVFNATTTRDADTGNPLGWPLEDNYGYFCDQRDKGETPAQHAPAQFYSLLVSQPLATPSQANLEPC